MKCHSVVFASLASFAANVSSAGDLLPPPMLTVTIETLGVEGARVETGKRYTIYVTTARDGSFSGLLIGEDGLEVHKNVPVRVQRCDDTSLRWPDASVAQVLSTSDAAVAQLIAPAVKLNPCIIALDLPLVAGSGVPARPNPGIPQ
jgi:hypothetical protein